jgi:hypothetical protein
MKMIFFCLAILPSLTFAADLHLRSGETAIIQANVTTRVTCNGPDYVSCQEPANALRLLISACKESYSGAYCADRYWSSFKQKNPGCIYAGMPICLEACKEDYGGAYCADRCQ